MENICSNIYVPQANDVNKFFVLIKKISKGTTSVKELSKVLNIKPRQVSYYAEACENLGLLVREKGNCFLSEDGNIFAALNENDQKKQICYRILKLPIITEIVAQLIALKEGKIHQKEIENLVGNIIDSSSTVERRVNSIMSWFKWIGENFGVFSVEKGQVSLMKNTKKA